MATLKVRTLVDNKLFEVKAEVLESSTILKMAFENSSDEEIPVQCVSKDFSKLIDYLEMHEY